ncbi:MAG TPA: gluconate:H+ symporter [Bryobacteraceae bacterium]|nr:gluconate:H+ symporter [Bryobacteraceae bacterium]
MNLILLAFGAVALLLFLILVVRMHAFLAMLISAFAMGLAAHMAPAAVLKSIQFGFGDALGFISVVLGLGAMIGAYLEHSGGGRALADYLIEKFGQDKAAWAMMLAAFLVGLPIFFEVGFIILVPLVYNLTREGKRSLLVYGLAMAAPLTVLHSLVPPHPAPAAAAQLLGTDLGHAILYGTLLAIPMTLVSGMMYGQWIAKRIEVPLPPAALEIPVERVKNPPSVGIVVMLLVLPVLLILGAAIWPKNQLMVLLGHPFSALLVTLVGAMVLLGSSRGMTRQEITDLANKALGPTASLLLIMGAGGALKQVIVDTGAGAMAGKMLAAAPISPLLVGFIMATVLRAAQGSATVSIITAAGIIAPIMKGLPGYRPDLMFLALCCGGTGFSIVNDAGFWIVNQYFGLTVPQTFKTWTAMKVISSLVGFGIVMAISALT